MIDMLQFELDHGFIQLTDNENEGVQNAECLRAMLWRCFQ